MGLFLLFGFIIVILIYLVYRVKIFQKKKEYMKQINETYNKNLQLKVEMKDLSRTKKENAFYELLDIPLVIATDFALKLEDLSKIDSNVIEALQFSSKEDLNNFLEIKKYLITEYGNLKESAVDGWIIRLRGYVGEHTIAEELIQQGYDVEFPSSPTQIGYDLIVDGELIQVKVGNSLSIVKNHLEKYPDIEVFASENLADKLQDPRVIGFESLDADKLDLITRDSIDSIMNLDIGLDGPVPLLFILTTGIREINAVNKGEKELKWAAFHGGVDVATKGVGLAAGAKAGAIAGAVFGPGGVAVGAAAGGLIGGVGGKFGGTYIKEFKLNKAIKEFENTSKNTAETFENTMLKYDALIEELVVQNNSKLEKLHKAQTEALQIDYAKYFEEIQLLQKKAIINFQHLLAEIQNGLEIEKNKTEKYLRPFKRYIFPNKNDVLIYCVYSHLNKKIDLIRSFDSKFNRITDTNIQYAEMLRFINEFKIGNNGLEESLENLNTKIESNTALSKKYIGEVALSANHYQIAFKKSILDLFSTLEKIMNDSTKLLEEKREKVKIELKKLGKDI